MTLPLNDIKTAPRDGKNVWVMPRLSYLCACRWDSETESWISLDGEEYHDSQVNGWLDLAALARDSERLNHILRNQGQCEIQPQPWIKDVFDATCETCPSNITQWEQAWLEKARAAIDKEMDNGA